MNFQVPSCPPCIRTGYSLILSKLQRILGFFDPMGGEALGGITKGGEVSPPHKQTNKQLSDRPEHSKHEHIVMLDFYQFLFVSDYTHIYNSLS